MERGEAVRWGAVVGVVVVSWVGMAVAVALDVPCKLDCPPDDDVTWADALSPAGGTGLSPPLPPLVVLLAGAAVASRRDRWGLLGLAVQLLVAAVMTFAALADAATVESFRGEHGGLAQLVSVLLVLFVVAAGATAIRGLFAWRSRVRAPAPP